MYTQIWLKTEVKRERTNITFFAKSLPLKFPSSEISGVRSQLLIFFMGKVFRSLFSCVDDAKIPRMVLNQLGSRQIYWFAHRHMATLLLVGSGLGEVELSEGTWSGCVQP